MLPQQFNNSLAGYAISFNPQDPVTILKVKIYPATRDMVTDLSDEFFGLVGPPHVCFEYLYHFRVLLVFLIIKLHQATYILFVQIPLQAIPVRVNAGV